MKNKRNGKEKAYSGSIYSASTAGRGEHIVPEHGEVMYGGGKYNNDAGMVERSEIEDFRS